MTDAETQEFERQREAAPQSAPAEPATARALWPTFMRRTLAEDALRREAAPQR